MTETEKKIRESLRFEIKCRRVLLKRLESPLKRANEAAKKEKDKRAVKVENARQYKDYNEAQDAYGFGCITEEEFDAIVDALELGEEYIENQKSPVEVAAEILSAFVHRLMREIADFEWELLPEKEKERIRKQNDEILARRRARQEVT